MSMGVPASNFNARGCGCVDSEIAAADSDGWTGFVDDSGALADWAASLEARKATVKSNDIELLIG
jgi:hypothetical protein